ncbi:HNH endonuclease signature motif containing protein [Ruegeria sp. HKCCE3926]|uniref:HNH endonuclease n=1 Tax=Ruegeria sp. HKCCE3926 TaxID=2794831 RepID=UPI001AE522C0|nr:HNH endonuclease signature motif containing protein [Ruegeria sp. HKCCE3926]
MSIKKRDIQEALERLKSGKPGKHRTRSRSTYVLCPVDHELWDLKAVMSLAAAISKTSKSNEFPRSFSTSQYERDLAKMGFPVVKFDTQTKRTLGVAGCDLSELQAPHTVFWPPDRREQRNGFQTPDTGKDDLKQQKRQAVVNQFVRNSELRRKVKDAANGFCDSCGERGFETLDGDWFLEVHHKKWLRDGGLDIEENMVALCPNCHRQEHHGTDRKYW